VLWRVRLIGLFVCLFVVSGGLVIEVLWSEVESVVGEGGVEGETGEDNS
jgi:hypothetical protein